MNDSLSTAKENFVHSMSRISSFWGFPKALGAIFGATYLSPRPITLDELVEEVGVSKGAVSTHVRRLERLGLIHKHVQLGDRKDYYVAETDFWKVVRGLLREREKGEFDRALRMVDESLEIVETAVTDTPSDETAVFYRERMKTMQGFFRSLDSLVAMVVALDNLRAGTLERLFGRTQ
ncbi:MAG: MarR family transcriptional regulator [Ardenticatenaceae bacterium]|nr:MarR family transcriptional regulator [Anaerolineales bacterium]MCB8922124.1 MarR family transcriptional regulator [Ardenticatenaceae bacterium]MCB8991104.1 MarR family transcriptional regulator [Ardenticatenaceae bacterium]